MPSPMSKATPSTWTSWAKAKQASRSRNRACRCQRSWRMPQPCSSASRPFFTTTSGMAKGRRSTRGARPRATRGLRKATSMSHARRASQASSKAGASSKALYLARGQPIHVASPSLPNPIPRAPTITSFSCYSTKIFKLYPTLFAPFGPESL